MLYLLVTESFSCVTLTVHSYVFQMQIETLHIGIKPFVYFKVNLVYSLLKFSMQLTYFCIIMLYAFNKLLPFPSQLYLFLYLE